jgi:fructokinase
MNLRPKAYTREIVIQSLDHADILKLNNEELEITAQMLGIHEGDETARYLMRHYAIAEVAITKGENGSVLYRNGQRYEANASAQKSVTDTVGAGDAYAAILAIGHLQRWSPANTVSVAAEFAGEICGIEGAVPSSDGFYGKIQTLIDGVLNEQ